MNKRFIAIFFLMVFSLTMVYATLDSLGTFQINESVHVVQVCSDATYINVSSISYPNSTIAVDNLVMTSAGSGEFYYDFGNATELGRYDVRGVSDGCGGTFSTYFNITYTGHELGLSNAIIYVVVLLFLLGLISYLVFIYPQLPRNETNPDGYVVGVSQLTYLRPIVIGFLWILTLAVTYIIANMAVAYIQAGFLGNFIFGLWRIMMTANFLIIPLWVIWIITSAFKQAKIKEFLERGGMDFA